MRKPKVEELDKTFFALKKKIQPYAKKLKMLTDRDKRYELCGEKEYEVTSLRTGKSTTKKNAYFVGIIVQKTYVGFYFMPPYTEKGFMDSFSDEMNKRLKGKSCFHFKISTEVTAEIDRLLKKGFDLFKKKEII